MQFNMESIQDSNQVDLDCVICFEPLFDQKKVEYKDADTGATRTKTVYTDDVITLRCSHQLHYKCIHGHLRFKRKCKQVYENAGMQSACIDDCPVCRDALQSRPDFGEKTGDRLFDSVTVMPDVKKQIIFVCLFFSLKLFGGSSRNQ